MTSVATVSTTSRLSRLGSGFWVPGSRRAASRANPASRPFPRVRPRGCAPVLTSRSVVGAYCNTPVTSGVPGTPPRGRSRPRHSHESPLHRRGPVRLRVRARGTSAASRSLLWIGCADLEDSGRACALVGVGIPMLPPAAPAAVPAKPTQIRKHGAAESPRSARRVPRRRVEVERDLEVVTLDWLRRPRGLGSRPRGNDVRWVLRAAPPPTSACAGTTAGRWSRPENAPTPPSRRRLLRHEPRPQGRFQRPLSDRVLRCGAPRPRGRPVALGVASRSSSRPSPHVRPRGCTTVPTSSHVPQPVSQRPPSRTPHA